MKWKSVQIPEALYREVAEKHEKHGYPSIASFITDATRRFLEKNAKEA